MSKKERKYKVATIILAVSLVLILILAVTGVFNTLLGSLNLGPRAPSLGGNPYLGGSTNPTGPPPSATPSTPYITLTIEPTICQRDDLVDVSISSNFPNQQFTFYVEYVGTSNWLTILSDTLGSNGDYHCMVKASNAGYWKVKVMVGSVSSNVVDLTVYGITIYTDKREYHPGEVISGAISGTYKRYYVLIFAKNHTDTNWTFTGHAYLTDQYGLVRWGQAQSQPIDPSQVGRTLDLIGIIDPDDPSGESITTIFEQYESYTIPESALDPFVKSNIITISIS